MKLHRFYNSVLFSGLFAVGALFTSCDDFLTVLPEDFTTEDQFWESKGDLLNVRAGAYKQLANMGENIIYWGELRADNLKLNKLDDLTLLYLQQAILRPNNSHYDWSAVYNGISLCNLILKKGAEMTSSEPLVDPTFSANDFGQYAADIMGLRALYYFYLVRAFRDVPYVTSSVSSDEEARKLYVPVTSGEAILGEQCQLLENAVGSAFTEESFTSASDKKGYFTQTAIHALLADMYLWRGCMLKNYSKKTDTQGHARTVNMTDAIIVGEAGDTTIVTADGQTVNDTYAEELSKQCFRSAVDHANEVLKIQMKRFAQSFQNASQFDRGEYEITEAFNSSSYTGAGIYPLYRTTLTKEDRNAIDQLYQRIWVNKNSQESIFEIQYDRTNTNPLYDWYGSYSSGSLNIGTMVASDLLVSKVSTKVLPADQGIGSTDLRALQTLGYTQTNLGAAAVPVHKNIVSIYNISEVKDMSKGLGTFMSYRSPQDANWPVYRLSDVMLIKAEALTRLNENLNEANYLVNHLYARNCPTMSEGDTTQITGQGNLLMKVYNERQREFVGEGKRWFDIVRQAEAGDYYGGRSVSVMENLVDFISVTNVVKNRMRSIWSFYCPFTDSEMRVRGIQAGGYLVQNPVWERYSEIK